MKYAALGTILICAFFSTVLWASTSELPMSRTFVGEKKFSSLVTKAQAENWTALPMGECIIKCARELHGIPYKSYTLEIDDHIESPSVNFDGLDCWTFFEIALGCARIIKNKNFSPEDLLKEIEWTRYRNGQCHGNYLDRIHYLAEWFFENEARGVAQDITRELGGKRFRKSADEIIEMTKLWKSYRYLRENPSLRKPMRQHEKRIAKLPVYYLPRSNVKRIEPKLKNGDIIGICTGYSGAYCCHVGIAIRTRDGVLRFMHASTNYKRVVIDKSLSDYLYSFKNHVGIIVARPLEPTTP